MKNQFISVDIEITKNLFLLGVCYFESTTNIFVKENVTYSYIKYSPSDIFDEAFYVDFCSVLKLNIYHKNKNNYLLAYNGKHYDFRILLAIIHHKRHLCNNKIQIVDFVLSLSEDIINEIPNPYKIDLSKIIYLDLEKEIFENCNILLCDPKVLIATDKQVPLKDYILRSEGILTSFDFEMEDSNMLEYNKLDCEACLKYCLDSKFGAYSFFQTHNSVLFKNNLKRLYSSSASVAINYLCEKLGRKCIGNKCNKIYKFRDILCSKWIDTYTAETKKLLSLLDEFFVEVIDNKVTVVDSKGKICKKTFNFLGYCQTVSLGGLHLRKVSEEKNNPVFIYPEGESIRYKTSITIDKIATDTRSIVNSDVSSYYPNILISLHNSEHGLQIGDAKTTKNFVDIFSEIVKQRMELKRKKEKTNEEINLIGGLKLLLNSTFGQLNYKFSRIKSSFGMLTITLNGQILLLNLISELHKRFNNFEVIFVNTDGMAFECDVEDKLKLITYIDEYFLRYLFYMEHSDLSRIILANVNSYAFWDEKNNCIKKKGRALNRTKNQPSCISELKDIYLSDRESFEEVGLDYFKSVAKKDLVMYTKVTSPLVISVAMSNIKSLNVENHKTETSKYFIPVKENGVNIYRIDKSKNNSVTLAKDVQILTNLEKDSFDYDNLNISIYKDMVIKDINFDNVQTVIEPKSKMSKTGLLLRKNVYNNAYFEEISILALKKLIESGVRSNKNGETFKLTESKLTSYRIQAAHHCSVRGVLKGISQYIILDVDCNAPEILEKIQTLDGLCLYSRTNKGYRVIVKLARCTKSLGEYKYYYKKLTKSLLNLDTIAIGRPLTIYKDVNVKRIYLNTKVKLYEMNDEVANEVKMESCNTYKEGMRLLTSFLESRYTQGNCCSFLYNAYKSECKNLSKFKYSEQSMRRVWGSLYLKDYCYIAKSLRLKDTIREKLIDRLESVFLNSCKYWTNKGVFVGYEEGLNLMRHMDRNPDHIKLQTFDRLYRDKTRIENTEDKIDIAMHKAIVKDDICCFKDTQILAPCGTGKTIYMKKIIKERDELKKPSCVVLPTKKDAVIFENHLKKEGIASLYMQRKTTSEEILQSSVNTFITHLPYGLRRVDGKKFNIIETLEEKFPLQGDHEKLEYYFDEVHQMHDRLTKTFQLGHKYKFTWKGSLITEDNSGTQYIFLEFVNETFSLRTVELEGFSREDLDILSIPIRNIFYYSYSNVGVNINGVLKFVAKASLTEERVKELLSTYLHQLENYIDIITDEEKQNTFLGLKRKLYGGYKILLNLLIHNNVQDVRLLDVQSNCKQSIYKGLHLEVRYHVGYDRKAFGFSATAIRDDITWDVCKIKPEEENYKDTTFELHIKSSDNTEEIESITRDTEEGLVVCSTLKRAKQLCYNNKGLILIKGKFFEVDEDLEPVESDEPYTFQSAMNDHKLLYTFFYSSDLESSNLFGDISRIHIEPQFKPQSAFIKKISSEDSSVKELVKQDLLDRLEQVLGRFIRGSAFTKHKTIIFYVKDSSRTILENYNFNVIRSTAQKLKINYNI